MNVRAAAFLAIVGGSLCAFGQSQPSPATRPADPGLVLDERCYFRSYYQLDWDRIAPEALKNCTPELLSKQELSSLEKMSKARLAHLKIDWTKEDWRDRAVIRRISRWCGTTTSGTKRRAGTNPVEW